MIKPNRNLYAPSKGRPAGRTRFVALVPLALAALLLAVVMPAASFAQDPGVDQYTPEAPDGGGAGGSTHGDGGAGSPVPTSGGDSDGSGGGNSGSIPADPTGTGVTPDTDAASGSGSGTGQSTGGKDGRALDGFAAAAANERNQRDDATGSREAMQLSAATGGESGIGAFVWIALGIIVLWAIVMAVVNFRRRRGDGGVTADAGVTGGEKRSERASKSPRRQDPGSEQTA